jgi:hypothetical protein
MVGRAGGIARGHQGYHTPLEVLAVRSADADTIGVQLATLPLRWI